MVNHPNRKRRVAAVDLETFYAETHIADFVRLAEIVDGRAGGAGPLFEADLPRGRLFEQFLTSLPALRQVHTCSCCRSFLNRYGALVRLTPEGETRSVLWDRDPEAVPPVYRDAVAALRRLVESAPLKNVFTDPAHRWGVPQSGGFNHLSVDARLVERWRLRNRTRTPGQERAQLRADRTALRTALLGLDSTGATRLVELLRRKEVNRSELFLGPVEWLLGQRAAYHAERDQRKRELALWRAVATAPAEGYLHPRQAVWWDLHVELSSADVDVTAALRRFAARTHGLAYQRPQAPPRAGQVDRAEKLFAELGLAPALRRRFARPDEVVCAVWQPPAPPVAPRGAGVFAHLRPGAAPPAEVDAPGQRLTWARFARVVLPTAETVEVRAPASYAYFAFLTATLPDAPPLLWWDRPDRRNPVSHYFWAGGARADEFNLTAHRFVEVTGVARDAATWRDDPGRPVPERVFVLLRGARDLRRGKTTGIALFPETLRPELREVRAVIEAHSRRAELDPVEGPVAAGIGFDGRGAPLIFRVSSSGLTTLYTVEGWD